MNGHTPEDGEPTSFVGKTKALAKKHKGKIITVVGVAAVAAVGVLASLRDEQDAADEWDVEDFSEPPAPVVEREKRATPILHQVSPYQRTLRDGRVIDVSGYERGVAQV
ncbi:hypothetical protein ABZX77_26140 [Streptomyces sp. NPDC004237]|uniref:hypothetical protein n=1 Tax=Streptomyces sp. NPDC004237 TaxID=3154455 RepID=UPI0033BE162E